MDKLLVAVEQRKDFKKVLTYDRDLQYLRVEVRWSREWRLTTPLSVQITAKQF